MTWHAFHHRGEILRTVVDTADQRRDGLLPMDLPGVSETFADELDLLAALMLRWHARLSGNIERELMQQPMDLELAVARAWRRTADDMPGVRLVLDRNAEFPRDGEMAQALRRAHDREWVRLAAAAGVANDESSAAAHAGRRIELAARALSDAPEPADTPVESQVGTRVVPEPTGSASLVERIRAVLAA